MPHASVSARVVDASGLMNIHACLVIDHVRLPPIERERLLKPHPDCLLSLEAIGQTVEVSAASSIVHGCTQSHAAKVRRS